jgi:hypothetical protein
MTANEDSAKRESCAKLRIAVLRALARYDNPAEKHNKEGGFPRGELAWAMASDLREAISNIEEITARTGDME